MELTNIQKTALDNTIDFFTLHGYEVTGEDNEIRTKESSFVGFIHEINNDSVVIEDRFHNTKRFDARFSAKGDRIVALAFISKRNHQNSQLSRFKSDTEQVQENSPEPVSKKTYYTSFCMKEFGRKIKDLAAGDKKEIGWDCQFLLKKYKAIITYKKEGINITYGNGDHITITPHSEDEVLVKEWKYDLEPHFAWWHINKMDILGDVHTFLVGFEESLLNYECNNEYNYLDK